MRRDFAEHLKNEIERNKNIVLMTADLGFGLWDSIKNEYPENYINVLSSEQLMIGMAAGMCLSGKIPVCYSITPFLLYRPFEFIRNYMNNDKIPIKLIGGGRGDDYAAAGKTHLAPESKKIMGVFENINSYYPKNSKEMSLQFNEFVYSNNPCYMSLKK